MWQTRSRVRNTDYVPPPNFDRIEDEPMKRLHPLTVAATALALLTGCAEHASEGPEEQPSMSIPDSVEMSAAMGEQTDQTIVVANEGRADLTVEWSEDVDWLEIDPAEIEDLEPDEKAELTFSGSCADDPDATGLHTTDVWTTSNDPTAEEFGLPVMLDCQAPEVASLTLSIAGLPDEKEADVQLIGPHNYQASLSRTATLDLFPGDYDLYASAVGDDTRYTPESESTYFHLEEGESRDLEVFYELVTGQLELQFSGLPDELEGRATVEGPAGFLETVEGNETLADLDPGTYPVVPEDVTDGPATHTAQPTTASVVSDATDTVDIDYETVPGDLSVDVAGLPDDLDHDVELHDPDGSIVEDVPDDGQLTALEPGDYTLVADPIPDAPKTWKASEVDVTVTSGEVAEATVEYLTDAGSLTVEVDGLPPELFHAIDLVDETGTTTPVPQSGEMTAVEPGTYTLEVRDVDDGPATWTHAGDSIDELVVTSGKEKKVELDYELVPASWHIDVRGLPEGVEAGVDVVGPDLDTTLTDSTSFDDDLTPGTYSVDPGEITEDPATWTAPETSVVVHSGDNSDLVVDYQTIPGELQVDVDGPDGRDAHIDIVDEDGLTVATVVESTTVGNLEPGTYQVAARDVDDGPGIWRAKSSEKVVSSGQPATQVTVDYDLVGGQLDIDAEGLGGLDLAATAEGPESRNVEEADTLNDLTPGDYEVTFQPVDDDGGDLVYRADPEVVDVVVESERTASATGHYQLVPGAITLEIDLPEETTADVHLRDDRGSVVWTRSIAGGADSTFTDLEPGTYRFDLADPVTDELGNEYVQFEGLDEDVQVVSDATADHTLSGTAPTVVTHEADDGLHSLRDVAERVVDGSVVTFETDVHDIELTGGEIAVDSAITIAGHGDGTPTISGEDDGRILNIGGFSTGPVLLESLTFEDGDASDDGGAVRAGPDLQIRDATFRDNRADGQGGAVYAEAELNLENVEFAANAAEGSGGAVNADDIYASNVRFADNQTELFGGALQARGDVELERTEFDGNTADVDAGALDVFGADAVSIDRSVLHDNTAERGGAIWVGADEGSIRNTTLWSNSADDSGGALFVADETNIDLVHVTVVANEAETGPGLFARSQGSTVRSSLFADNTYTGEDDTDPEASEIYVDDDSALASNDYNFVGRLDDQFLATEDDDEFGTLDDPEDALADPLELNGAFLKTVRLDPDSPAHQSIPEAECVDADADPVVVDQRGFTRPVDGQCTRGAWQAEMNFEGFSNHDLGHNYNSGEFVGNDDITWHYDHAADERSYPIQDDGLMLGDETSRLWAEDIEGGVDTFYVQYRRAHSGDYRQFEILIDDQVEYTSPNFDGDADEDDPTIYRAELTDLDVDASFDVEINNLGEQAVFDNIYWE